MNRKTLSYLSIGLVIVGLLVAVGLASRVPDNVTTAPTPAPLHVGQVAPEFTVSSTGGYFDLHEQHKPVLLEIFATWCPHCQHEVSILNTLHQEYQNRLAIIAVSGSEFAIDRSSPASQLDVINFANTFHVTYPVAFDPNLAVAHQYFLGGFPTIVVITKSGNIASFSDGEETEASLRKRLKAVLASK